ncbi:XRE family transcriptional regulator [Robertmurraya yapensis]|uniref:XRE family transcriptional regulator n=2 Tax=Bacillaceae TaxID=186817 RepID=A0A431W7D2_9BACI|nr:helix-turn-helix transcriptional regulator [Bacillus yapensis]RTR31402.1 XRE family transcriptional regulator [Bacillus yapensis]TKS95626.1 helix-turn-helix transcriptional regulator [Bacillus yapensis]
MPLQELLKSYREKNNFTQEELAKKLTVSRQAVSKWENGNSIPDVYNLISLSDLYDISLDELIRGAVYFPKPFIVGKKITKKFMLYMGFLLTIFYGFILITLDLLTPFLSLLIAISIYLFIMLPTFIEPYWIITKTGIVYQQFPRYIDKIKYSSMILFGKEISYETTIPFNAILSISVIYEKKSRNGPMDINPDYLYIRLCQKNGSIKDLNLYDNLLPYLPQAISYFEKKKITVTDKNKVTQAIMSEKTLYEIMHGLESNEHI